MSDPKTWLGGGPTVHVSPLDARWVQRDDHGHLRYQQYDCAQCESLGLARAHGIPPVGVILSIHPDHSGPGGSTREQEWFCSPACARDWLDHRIALAERSPAFVNDGTTSVLICEGVV